MKYRGNLDIPLRLILVGTGNSLSKDITNNIDNLEQFVKIIALKHQKSFDIGKATSTKKSFYFVYMMEFGFTTDVTLTASKFKYLVILPIRLVY